MMRLVGLSVVAVLLACSGPIPKQLAGEQTLRIPIDSDPSAGFSSLDPAQFTFGSPLDVAIAENLFNGLYRYDERMQEQPDIAKEMPTISSDGLTYTFRLRHDVRFWNGDRVTADDVIYSWNRTVARQAGPDGIFLPVAGYDAVANARAVTNTTRLALSAPDPYTLVAHLSAPSGYWLAELGLAGAWLVDQKAITEGGEEWWKNPKHLVGTGPFRLTEWRPNLELDFGAVSNWWGGSTGAIRRVELHVADTASQWTGYANGTYDLIGFGKPNLGFTGAAEIGALLADQSRRRQVHTWPYGSTTMVGFNLQSGPFSGYQAGRDLRRAFSQAIDRNMLAQAVCRGGTICVPATGGLISKGLTGYLGDGEDPNARFDPVTAQATVERLDPDGSLLRGLVYYYRIPANDPAQAIAENLTAQWRSNLKVDVKTVGLDTATYFHNLFANKLTLFRRGWEADYDHPQDWFDNTLLFNSFCGQPPCGTIYDRPGYRALIMSADKKPLVEALPDYVRAGRMLMDDAALAVLNYAVRATVIKPYVQGYGANALWETRWTSLEILQH
jgi:ABC-type oligopeptide transport system substrate-binding subunit